MLNAEMECLYCGGSVAHIVQEDEIDIGFMMGPNRNQRYPVRRRHVVCSGEGCKVEYSMLGDENDKGFFKALLKNMIYSEESFAAVMAEYGLKPDQLVDGFKGITSPAHKRLFQKNEFHAFAEVRGVLYHMSYYRKGGSGMRAIGIVAVRGIA